MFHRLDRRENNYFINSRRSFQNMNLLSLSDVEDCFDFAYNMTFGAQGAHRNHRSGGQVRRRNGQIFIDAFQGKLAEFAFYNYFAENGFALSEPDMSIMGLNQWDGCDFLIDGKQVAIKSTKSFGQLLLLETKDWDLEGKYKANYGTDHTEYDYFVLIRIAPDGTAIMSRNRWLYSDAVEYNNLKENILSEDWQSDISGYISQEELVSIICNNYVLPQNSYLNGKTRMDAENYYVQVGDMHHIETLLR